MEIKTQFDIGQKVFWVSDYEIFEIVIVSIEIFKDLIVYRDSFGVDYYNDFLFATRKDAEKFLRECEFC